MKRTITERTKQRHWLRQIDRILTKDVRFVFNRRPAAKKTLEGIRKTIEESGHVTKNQIRAIKNFKYGRNERDED